MTTREILTAARQRLAAGWTQNAGRRGKDGTPYPALSETVAWCPTAAVSVAGEEIGSLRARFDLEDAAMGALLAALIPDERQRAAAVREHARACHVIQRWNDMGGRTQAEVLALFDRALRSCPTD